MTDWPEPDAIARELIDTNRYLVLGTIDPDGRPRVSPVYFAPAGYHVVYWISSPDTHHSRNIEERPDVNMVIFDSTAPIGSAQAVYLTGRAARIPDHELDQHVEVACRARFPEQQPFPAAELRPPEAFRLYRAEILVHEVHIRGLHPVYGTGVDRRMAVTL